MKKQLLFISGAIILSVPFFMGNKELTELKWNSESGEETGYFQKTGSGIIHEWSGDKKLTYKPKNKFRHIESCPKGSVVMDGSWNPYNLAENMDESNQEKFWSMFADTQYLLCSQPSNKK